MRLFQLPRRRELIEATDNLLDQRQLAMSLVVAMQVHVSLARIALLERQRETEQDYLMTQSELLGLVRTEAKLDRVGEQTLLREELNGVIAKVRVHISEAQLESAHAALAVAIGMDPPGFDPASAGEAIEASSPSEVWKLGKFAHRTE